MDEHGVCCYNFVGVNSKTLVHFLLFYFPLFNLCFLLFTKTISQFFETSLRFN